MFNAMRPVGNASLKHFSSVDIHYIFDAKALCLHSFHNVSLACLPFRDSGTLRRWKCCFSIEQSLSSASFTNPSHTYRVPILNKKNDDSSPFALTVVKGPAAF